MQIAIFTKPPFIPRVRQPSSLDHDWREQHWRAAVGETRMNEVSDGSNTSSASETSTTGAQLAPPAPSQQLSQQEAASGRDLFDDRILTVSSADGERVSPILPIKGDGGDSKIAFGAVTPGTAELRIADDGMSLFGTDRDSTTTAASASHLGDMIQSDPVATPNLDESRASQRVSIPASPADRSAAANDVSEPLAPGRWHDAGSSVHRNGASSRGTGLNDDAGSADVSDPSQHDADHRTSSSLDVLPLDNIVDFDRHHDAPAHDDAHGSGHHNDAASSGTSLLASDGAETHHAQAAPPSSGALVEAGTKAILLASDESPNRIGPHASAADFAPGATPSHSHTTAAFSPAVLGARDQLASAIATATPEAAAITTLPPPQAAGAAIPTLGSDMHALQKHAA